jgi:hypothetical protein
MSMPIPVLSIVGLNIDSTTKEYIKQLMHKALLKEPIAINIKILPDPENKFDSNAIKVLFNDTQIGFISKNDQCFFDFSRCTQYTATIVSWGVMKDASVYIYIQPIGS